MKQISSHRIKPLASPEKRLMSLWVRLGHTTYGRFIFNLLLRHTVPYSGTIRAQVVSLSPGQVEVIMKDRRRVRNHLNCIHAIALANLGELASGLAMLSALKEPTYAIVSDLKMEYLKKARGQLTAKGLASAPDKLHGAEKVMVHATIKNEHGEVVAKAYVTWHLSPKLRE